MSFKNQPMTWHQSLLLYVITDPESSRGMSHVEVAKQALEGGATALQLRDKNLFTRQLVEKGLEIRKLTRHYGALFLVNDRVDVALAVEADGVHLGQEDMPLHVCRKLVGPRFIIGISARTPEKAREAELGGADYLGSGAVYRTSTKENASSPMGPQGLAEICDSVNLPVVGIGGIGLEKAEEVMKAGAAGVAVISAVVAAQDPAGACRQFRQKLDKYQ